MSEHRRAWQIVLNVGYMPLGVVGVVLVCSAKLIDSLGEIVFGAQYRWLLAVRRWSGLTPRGETAEQVREAEERRERTLAGMRTAAPSKEGSQ